MFRLNSVARRLILLGLIDCALLSILSPVAAGELEARGLAIARELGLSPKSISFVVIDRI